MIRKKKSSFFSTVQTLSPITCVCDPRGHVYNCFPTDTKVVVYYFFLPKMMKVIVLVAQMSFLLSISLPPIFCCEKINWMERTGILFISCWMNPCYADVARRKVWDITQSLTITMTIKTDETTTKTLKKQQHGGKFSSFPNRSKD